MIKRLALVSVVALSGCASVVVLKNKQSGAVAECRDGVFSDSADCVRQYELAGFRRVDGGTDPFDDPRDRVGSVDKATESKDPCATDPKLCGK